MRAPPSLAFSYVPFGASSRAAAIACDGLVEGAELHASHWAGNRTPADLKADTSVEIALRWAERGVPQGALVTNNHFDTDGVLAVFALLEPDRAARHAALLTAAAEAGDFDEWPADDRGLRLDMAIRALAARAAGDDRATYAEILPLLGDLVEDVDARRELWEPEWQALLEADRRADAGALEVAAHGRVAVFLHRPGVDELPGPVLARRQPAGALRWLLAFEDDGGMFRYRYERPRWAWAETVRRPSAPPPSRNAIAQDLGEDWAIKGGLGMTGLLRTTRPVETAPADVLAVLARRDPGAR